MSSSDAEFLAGQGIQPFTPSWDVLVLLWALAMCDRYGGQVSV